MPQFSAKHAPAECPRCGRLIDCKQNTPHKCNCVKISLTQEQIHFIREEMLDETDCLCATCLDDFKNMLQVRKTKHEFEAF